MSYRVLVVDDEEGITMMLSDRLQSKGYAVESASDGISGLNMARATSYDAIILDLMLPGKSGMDVCHELRAHGLGTPILMLTARGALEDKVDGLRAGADDYLAKPFEMDELVARLHALIRRSTRAVQSTRESYDFGDFRLDIKSQRLYKADQEIPVSNQEFRLLAYLVQHEGELMSRKQLLEAVWGYQAIPNTRTVDVHVAWLRSKIETTSRPRFILTVRGKGYKFVQE